MVVKSIQKFPGDLDAMKELAMSMYAIYMIYSITIHKLDTIM